MNTTKFKNNFINKANEIWDNKYDYSKIQYVDRKTPVCIICPEHGEFWITPNQHVGGHGCTKCAKNGKKTTEGFINESCKIHGNKYDYSKVEYINSQTKVCIICPKHGEFWQLPNAHKRGQGCPKCHKKNETKKAENNNQVGLKKFIEKARKIHGDKYDYSKSIYETYKHSICIICPEHGEFWQRPDSHLKGGGCPKCGRKNIGMYHGFTTETWVQRAKEIHGDKYDYSKVEYKNAQTKICIICPEHGEFWQLPNSHLQGSNCPICGDLSRREYTLQKYTTEFFIERAKKIHGDKYDYSKTEYKGYDKKVCIICPEHGEFWQTATTHLSNKGCPKCKTSKIEKKVNFLLEGKNIKTIYEYTPDFLNMGSKQRYRLDFYLPDYNIAIECQGEQHFIPVDFSGKRTTIETQKHFDRCVKRDLRKKRLCEDNGIKLLYYADETIKVPKEFNLYEVIRNENDLLKEIFGSLK